MLFDDIPFCPDPFHPIDGLAQFPMSWSVEFVKWVLQQYATPDCIVIDPMAGAGATLVAALDEGHQCLGIDADPLAVVLTYTKLAAAAGVDLANGRAFVEGMEHSGVSVSRICLELANTALSFDMRATAALHLYRRATGLPSDLPSGRTGSPSPASDRPYDPERRSPIIWADCFHSSVWAFARDMLPSKPWLLVTSPPHPNSRGRPALRESALTDAFAFLARECGTHHGWNHATLDAAAYSGESLLSLLTHVGRHSSPRTLAVIEYEITDRGGNWVHDLANTAASIGWHVVAKERMYSDAPDGRSGVIEGGLVVVRRS
jgi:hypothetical protein